MKKILILSILIILFSCSQNDDDDDDSNREFIVGEWKIIERYDDSNIEVELGTCDPFVVYQFNSDFSMLSYLINRNEIPINIACGLLWPGAYEWNKVGENSYKSRHVDILDLLDITYEKDGEYLILTYSSTGKKAVLKRN